MPPSGIITRAKAQSYNAAFKAYGSQHFAPEIKALFWENLNISGEAIRAVLTQKDQFGNECKDLRAYPGIRNLAQDGEPEELSFTIIFVGVDELGNNMYQKEIVLQHTPPGDPALTEDMISDEHDPCKPPPPCPLL
ncbi:hypothetical protein [Runella sp.]|uniref:hypothetical protein n=1 Tax=Runella sp. TaxID=1960881 RepID=UPI003D0FF3B9